MGAKAVYASQSLSVYFSGPDLDLLLERGGASVDLVDQNKQLGYGQVHIALDASTAQIVKAWVQAERDAIEKARADHDKYHAVGEAHRRKVTHAKG